MKKVTVHRGQTIYDLALMHYGSILGLEYLIADNDGILVAEIEGMEVNVRREAVVNQSVVDYFSNRQITTY